MPRSYGRDRRFCSLACRTGGLAAEKTAETLAKPAPRKPRAKPGPKPKARRGPKPKAKPRPSELVNMADAKPMSPRQASILRAHTRDDFARAVAMWFAFVSQADQSLVVLAKPATALRKKWWGMLMRSQHRRSSGPLSWPAYIMSYEAPPD
jgi:hypothetical protein